MTTVWRGAMCALVVVTFAAEGCAAKDPEPTAIGGSGGGVAACAADENVMPDSPPGCQAQPEDYTPRLNASMDDSYPACISDGNSYVPIQAAISSNARVAAFEAIASLLRFGTGEAPSPAEFVQARTVYTEPEGLDSRVSRREDEHYPPAAEACRNLSPEQQEAQAERCVGPARIQPLLSKAFNEGSQGLDAALNSARIEAALLWFLYVSVYKEAVTCADKAKDCDSSSGYYSGFQQREKTSGFARYVAARSPTTHDAAFDAILAVRCWRDLDNPGGLAENAVLHQQALGQLDRALDAGLARILLQRIERQPCDSAWETLRLLGPVLIRALEQKDSAASKAWEAALAQGATSFDAAAAAQLVRSSFPCP